MLREIRLECGSTVPIVHERILTHAHSSHIRMYLGLRTRMEHHGCQ
jgi:hypothetical protein